MKVLIAEDDTNTRSGLEEILRNEGYETVAAADGAEAIALFEREAPDFVCLDIMIRRHPATTCAGASAGSMPRFR